MKLIGTNCGDIHVKRDTNCGDIHVKRDTNCGDIHVKRDTNFKYCNIAVNKQIQDFGFNPFYLYGTVAQWRPSLDFDLHSGVKTNVYFCFFSDFNIIILVSV
jgi:hypothetical protein